MHKRESIPANKILVVEPEAGICGLVRAVAMRHGFDVAVARDGKEAMRATLRARFIAFIVDVGLRPSALEPGVRGGMGFLHYLQKHDLQALRRVIVLCGLSRMQLPSDMPPVCSFLTKPFDLDDLTVALASCCELADTATRC